MAFSRQWLSNQAATPSLRQSVQGCAGQYRRWQSPCPRLGIVRAILTLGEDGTTSRNAHTQRPCPKGTGAAPASAAAHLQRCVRACLSCAIVLPSASRHRRGVSDHAQALPRGQRRGPVMSPASLDESVASRTTVPRVDRNGAHQRFGRRAPPAVFCPALDARSTARLGPPRDSGMPSPELHRCTTALLTRAG